MFNSGSYGVATGWGWRCLNANSVKCQPFPVMKQMQMKIQDENVLKKNLNIPDVPKDFPMFCAGDQGNVNCKQTIMFKLKKNKYLFLYKPFYCSIALNLNLYLKSILYALNIY